MVEVPDDLDETLAAAFRMLEIGAADPRNPFRTPSLATIDADAAPSQRIVVLRAFDAGARTLRVHTDQRSAKARALARDPRASLLFYDADTRVQIRLTGRASLHATDALADAAWSTSQPSSRTCYASKHPPGMTVPAPPDAPRDADSGRAHFLVLLVTFDRLEWLWLAASGHRRAVFTWHLDALRAAWLAP